MNEVSEIGKASRIAGMHRNTGGKYLKSGPLPDGARRPNVYIRPSSIHSEDWDALKNIFTESPELEATAAMEYLMEQHPDRYTGKELRTLQRKISDWKTLEGKERAVMFSQIYRPGERSQSDFVDMDYLHIMIHGEQFDHLIFHFMLPYSGWEHVLVCDGGESFVNLCAGYEQALWRLGGAPKIHRTDNLTAAITSGTWKFTDNWSKLMQHYKVEPTTNNPGKSNENGKVERSNGLIKRGIENHLALRGSKHFKSRAEYVEFIERIVEKRNKQRAIKLTEEIKELQALPDSKWYAAYKIPVRVNTDSTIRVEGASYSVPSRTIGQLLSAYVYPDKIEIYYGSNMIQEMPKSKKGESHINFMHVISSLRRKPGAFEDYKYKESMYPTAAFRQTYDALKGPHKNKQYIEILYLAAIYGVENVSAMLTLFLEAGVMPKIEDVRKKLIYQVTVPNVDINKVCLKDYDALTKYMI